MLLLVGFVSMAKGEVLEMRYFGIASQTGADLISFDVVSGMGSGVLEAVFIWDTEAAPTFNDGVRVRFPILDYTITFHDMAPDPDDDIVITPESGVNLEFEFDPGSTARLRVTGLLSNVDPPAGVNFRIDWFGMNNSFSIGMTSMPNDPVDYAVNLTNAEVTETDFLWHNLVTGGSSISGHEVGIGFVPDNHPGKASYVVTIHTPPAAEPCSPADLNGDGEIDFLDISEFVSLYSTGCP